MLSFLVACIRLLDSNAALQLVLKALSPIRSTSVPRGVLRGRWKQYIALLVVNRICFIVHVLKREEESLLLFKAFVTY